MDKEVAQAQAVEDTGQLQSPYKSFVGVVPGEMTIGAKS
jgi:hypothetical protein